MRLALTATLAAWLLTPVAAGCHIVSGLDDLHADGGAGGTDSEACAPRLLEECLNDAVTCFPFDGSVDDVVGQHAAAPEGMPEFDEDDALVFRNTFYVRVDADPGFEVAESFTIEARFRFTSVAAAARTGLIDQWQSFGLFFHNDGSVSFSRSMSDPTRSADGLLALGSWHHLAATLRDGSITLFLDGKDVASGPVGSQLPAADAIYIGATNFDGNPIQHLQGAIDFVQLMPRALRPDEVACRAMVE